MICTMAKSNGFPEGIIHNLRKKLTLNKQAPESIATESNQKRVTFTYFGSAVRRITSQIKHQLDATLCRSYFCRVTLHVSGASAHHREYLKLVQRPLVRVLSLQVSHHITLLGPKLNACWEGIDQLLLLLSSSSSMYIGVQVK